MGSLNAHSEHRSRLLQKSTAVDGGTDRVATDREEATDEVPAAQEEPSRTDSTGGNQRLNIAGVN
jgi:hypothetical protein